MMDKKEENIDKALRKILEKFAETLPKFSDGRINYSHSDKAPVLVGFVKFRDKILLLRRSNKVGAYQEKWNAVAGYLDEFKPLRTKALEEFKEELGLEKNNVSGGPFW